MTSIEDRRCPHGRQFDDECYECEIDDRAQQILELQNQLASGVHTCSNTCQRPMCVLRRKIKELEAQNAGLIMSLRELEEKLQESQRGTEMWLTRCMECREHKEMLQDALEYLADESKYDKTVTAYARAALLQEAES